MPALLNISAVRRRSREGAWIEINAPPGCVNHTGGRSREGAWIEIVAVDKSKVGDCGRSREGAWIEIHRLMYLFSACWSLP